jgi:excisionase family DNA binding protein
MKNSILVQLSPEELTELIKVSLKIQLEDLKSEFIQNDPDELLTREEACKYFQIDSSTLWHWTNKGKVVAYGMGNRRYYKRSELNESLTPLKK